MALVYSIYEAKAKLSEIIRVVKTRRSVVITERGIPVAEVVPYDRGKAEALQERMARLASLGAILPAKGEFQAAPAAKIPGAVRRFLSRDRD